MSEYVNGSITSVQIAKLMNIPGWHDFFCENKYGYCFWNNQTGEILWEATNNIDSNASLLQDTWDKLLFEE
jgi:hypothetical protein